MNVTQGAHLIAGGPITDTTATGCGPCSAWRSTSCWWSGRAGARTATRTGWQTRSAVCCGRWGRGSDETVTGWAGRHADDGHRPRRAATRPRSRDRCALDGSLPRRSAADRDRRPRRLDDEVPPRPSPRRGCRVVATGAKPQPASRATDRRHGSRPWPRRSDSSIPATTAAHSYGSGTSDETRVALLEALERLCEALFPHLEREEHETMPLVSVSITAAEWHAIDQQYFIKPKSLPQLGFEGHWLLDGLDPERSQLVVHQVPPIPRLVLVHGFARRYRRQATACWGPAAAASGSRSTSYGPAATLPRRIPRTGHVDIVVDAPIDAVWNVVTDVTRVGEWSHECRRVEWLDGATEAAPGVRFRGTNKAGPWTWSRINEVLVVDEPTHVRVANRAHAPVSRQQRVAIRARVRRRRDAHHAVVPGHPRAGRARDAVRDHRSHPSRPHAPASPTTCAGSASSRPRSKDRDW